MRTRLRETLLGYLFIIPVFAFIMLFIYFPVIKNLRMSFYDWSLISNTRRFIGTYNYGRLLTDFYFWNSVKITAVYVLITVPITMGLSLFMALLVNQQIRCRTLFRTAYFIPNVISTASAAIIFVWMYEPSGGLFNLLLSSVGIRGPSWLQDPNWALRSIGIYTVWKDLGYYMIIFLAGLQNIPKQQYEAAEIDGANSWQQFWRITLPLVSPTTFLVSVMAIIGAWKIFNSIHIMTQGGPISSTSTIVYYIYKQAFETFNMGYSSAISNVFFVVVLSLTVIQFVISRKFVHYQ